MRRNVLRWLCGLVLLLVVAACGPSAMDPIPFPGPQAAPEPGMEMDAGSFATEDADSAPDAAMTEDTASGTDADTTADGHTHETDTMAPPDVG